MTTKSFLVLGLFSALSVCVRAQKVVGGDLSLVPAYEAAGDVWLDADGHQINTFYSDGMITFVKDVAQWNAVRVRLMVDPTVDTSPATCQDIEYVKKLGKRIKSAGMSFMLDIFYSDTWTDVSQQWIPKSWNMNRNTPVATLAAKVKAYTKEVIDELADNGAKPDFVQVGNEVSYGMLWDTQAGASKNNTFYFYGSYNDQKNKIERFAQLLKAASEGVRASKAPEAKIVLHCERTMNAGNTIDFYDWVGQAGFNDYDIMGLSYYPQWHGTLDQLKATIKELHDTFEDKEIQIVETGYIHDTNGQTLEEREWPYSPAGQAAFLKDLIALLKQFECVTGLYYWQPEECGNGADAEGNNRVMGNWDGRGFWQITWKSGTHALQSEAALMALRTFVLDEVIEPTDISSQFTNLNFEECDYNETGGYATNCPGWEISYNTPWSDGPWPKKANEWHSSLADGLLLQGWNASGNTVKGEIIYQSLDNLPAGTYTISAAIHIDYDGFRLFANDDETAVTKTTDWGTAFETKVTTTLNSTGLLRFGLKVADGLEATQELNLYADNFKVLYSPEIAKNPCDVNSDGKVNISDVVDVINIIAAGTNDPRGDVTGDKNVNITDVVTIINTIAGA